MKKLFMTSFLALSLVLLVALIIQSFYRSDDVGNGRHNQGQLDRHTMLAMNDEPISRYCIKVNRKLYCF